MQGMSEWSRRQNIIRAEECDASHALFEVAMLRMCSQSNAFIGLSKKHISRSNLLMGAHHCADNTSGKGRCNINSHQCNGSISVRIVGVRSFWIHGSSI